MGERCRIRTKTVDVFPHWPLGYSLSSSFNLLLKTCCCFIYVLPPQYFLCFFIYVLPPNTSGVFLYMSYHPILLVFLYICPTTPILLVFFYITTVYMFL